MVAGWIGRCVLGGLAVAMLSGVAAAQSMEPMRGEVVSFADRFALKVYPGNPYDRHMPMQVRVYDTSYRPIGASVIPAQTVIGAKQKRRVLVIVPFDGADRREVKICAEAAPLDAGQTRIRIQSCGHFVAIRRVL